MYTHISHRFQPRQKASYGIPRTQALCCDIFIQEYTYIYTDTHVCTPTSTTAKSEQRNLSDTETRALCQALCRDMRIQEYIYIYIYTCMHTESNHGKKRATQSLRHSVLGSSPSLPVSHEAYLASLPA